MAKKKEIIGLLQEAYKKDRNNDFIKSLNRSATQFCEQERRINKMTSGKVKEKELKTLDTKFERLMEMYNDYKMK